MGKGPLRELPAATSAVVVMAAPVIAVERVADHSAHDGPEERGTRVYRLLVCVGRLVGIGIGRRAGRPGETAPAVVIRDPGVFLRLRAMRLVVPHHPVIQISAALLRRYRHGARRDE